MFASSLSNIVLLISDTSSPSEQPTYEITKVYIPDIWSCQTELVNLSQSKRITESLNAAAKEKEEEEAKKMEILDNIKEDEIDNKMDVDLNVLHDRRYDLSWLLCSSWKADSRYHKLCAYCCYRGHAYLTADCAEPGYDAIHLLRSWTLLRAGFQGGFPFSLS